VAFGFSGIHDEDEAKDINDRVKIIELPKIEAAAPKELANAAPATPAETPEAAQKRHRRTKAEMSAARAAETPTPPEQTTAPDPEPQPSASGPSDRDKLKILVEEADFTEAQALHTLRRLKFAPPNAVSYADLNDEAIASALAQGGALIAGISETFA